MIKFILLLIMVNTVSAQQDLNSSKSKSGISNNFHSEINSMLNINKKQFSDIRISLGGGIGILNGNKYTSLNLQSAMSKSFTVSMGLDYYFIKDKEERQLENFVSPAMVILYNAGSDRQGNELLFGAGLSYQNFEQIKPLVTIKGNLYLKNHFYLGLEIKQPFLDAALGGNSNTGIFISPYIGVNFFYRLTN